jgi:hypothetical protein
MIILIRFGAGGWSVDACLAARLSGADRSCPVHPTGLGPPGNPPPVTRQISNRPAVPAAPTSGFAADKIPKPSCRQHAPPGPVPHEIGGPAGFELATAVPARIASLTLLTTTSEVTDVKSLGARGRSATAGSGNSG